MTPSEASDITDRIMRTWPRMVIPPDEWIDALTPLDAGTTGTAYIRLRNDQPRPPSIAEFVAVYRSLATPANMPIREQCDACGGDGFNTIHETVHGITYEALTACRCSNGAAAQRTLDDTRYRNDAELDRLFPGRTKRADPRVHQHHDEQPRLDIA